MLELTRGMILLPFYYNCLENLCQSEILTKPPGLIGSNAQKLASATFFRPSGCDCNASAGYDIVDVKIKRLNLIDLFTRFTSRFK